MGVMIACSATFHDTWGAMSNQMNYIYMMRFGVLNSARSDVSLLSATVTA